MPCGRCVLHVPAQARPLTPFEVLLPALSKHLKVLEHAGLLRRSVEGRVHHCRLEAAKMKDAARWINRYGSFWEGQFASLDRYLARTHNHVATKVQRKKGKGKS